MPNRPPIQVKLVPASSFYDQKPFNTDEWVGPTPGVWRGGNKIYIKIEDMEDGHLGSAISFVERRDKNYRQSKVWAALVTEYWKRKEKEAPPEKESKKRKFRLGDDHE